MNRNYGMFCGIMLSSLLLFSSLGTTASAQILPLLQPPTNLTAHAVSTSQINLSWSQPANLGNLVLTGYKIERSVNGGSWSTIVSNTGSTGTTYSDTGLSPSTTYTYRVSAITILLVSSPSNTASATTASPITVPQPPTGLTASADSFSQITLNWNAPTNDGGSAITGYKIARSSDGGSTWITIVSNTGSTSTAYSNSGLSPNTTYSYRVYAINSVGTSSPSNIASATTNTQLLPPQPPTGLTATAISSSQINLSWTAPNNNGGSSITGYKIEQSTDSGSTWNVIVSNTGSTGTTYSNTGLSPSTTYTYRVSTINSVGTSSPSSISSATTNTQLFPPQPPTNLSATAVSSSQINLSWNAPSNNGGSPITGYKINRSDDGGTTWITLVQNTQNTGTTYSDTGLSPSTTYTYRVSAINSIGTSSTSNTAIATTIAQVHTITRSQSGLVASDPLNNETKTQQEIFANQQYWKDGGDAIAENAPYEYSKDSQGLHIGVQAPANGTWAGMYSVTPNTNAMLFHSVITTPVNFIPYQWYENGMYVQTAASQNVNYVTCVAATSQWGLDWLVVSTTGNVNQATQFNVLYADPSSNQPLTRDCTIITNGNNYLKVYLDGTMVYNNSTMNLQMPGPFNAFLEPQSSYPGKMLDGIYKDYYATTDENIKITNNPSNAARVDLVDTSGTVIASSPVSSGTGTINVGSYHFPLAGTIKVYDGSNNVIASTSSMVNIFGGDVYSVS